MRFCYEKKEGCCCVPISNLVCAFLTHLTIHGSVIAVYVFTTKVNPPLYVVDYFFGYMGVALSVTSFVTIFFIRTKKCQCIRGLLGLLVALAICGNFGGTFWYSAERWKAHKATAVFIFLTRGRGGHIDPFWYAWLVFCWIVAVITPYYLFCIVSCMCNKYKTHLFTSEYQHAWDENQPDTTIEINRYTPESYDRNYKPYPVQRA